jgi:hypothetical protein
LGYGHYESSTKRDEFRARSAFNNSSSTPERRRFDVNAGSTGALGARNYRFFSVALAVLRRGASAAAVGFDALAGPADRGAATLARRTPGCSPFVNSTPAASSARWITSNVAR